MNKIIFHDTHAYPGCPATVVEKVVPEGTAVPAIAEFSDGSTAAAEFEQLSPEEMVVHIEAYTTARHTRIPAKTWRISYNNAPDLWKVVARL